MVSTGPPRVNDKKEGFLIFLFFYLKKCSIAYYI